MTLQNQHLRTAGLALAVALAGGLLPQGASAAPIRDQLMLGEALGGDAGGSRVLSVPKDKSMAFRIDGPVAQVVVSQPKMLEIVATTGHTFYARGLAVGSTNILVYDKGHTLIQVIDAKIGFDTDALTADLAAAIPDAHITAVNCADGVLLTGDVANDAMAARAKLIAERYAPGQVTSALSVQASQQVMVEVRVLEVGRNALKDFGVEATVTNAAGGIRFSTNGGIISSQPLQGALTLSGHLGGGNNLDVTLNALESKGVIHTLARPNLVALSGEDASFLAGGEIPYPVPQGLNQVTIAFRPFGVTLNFTPTVLDGGMIKLKVNPEVSQLDQNNALRLNGVSVPALTVRRASTTIELRDGQSFAIAGLFQQDYANTVRQLPWVGDLPVLGALFRSSDWQKQQTELVIIATIHMVTPTERGAPPPTLGVNDEPDAIELMLEGKTAKRPLAPAGAGAAPSVVRP